MPKLVLDIKLYTVGEVADLLGVAYQTVQKYISDKRLKATLIGGKRYCSEENIKEFLTGAQ